MKRRLLLLLFSLAVAAPALAQNDCGPNLRCGQVPWALPVMPILVSPTPLGTSAPYNPTPAPTDQSGYIVPTPITCGTPVPLGTDYKQTVSNTGPSAYWPLDETSGTTMTDASGHGHNGTLTGVTLDSYTLAGGGAPSFDGINDSANAGSMASIMNAGQFTVSLWMRVATSWSGSGTLINFSDTQVFRIARSGGSIVLTSGANTASASASANTTNWVHVAAVISRPLIGGQSARLYINGANVASANTAPGTFTVTDTLYIGSTGSGTYFAGGIGHVAVWNRALSASELSAIANAAPAAVYTPTPDPNCDSTGGGIDTGIDVNGISELMATLQTLPVNAVGIENPQAGVDLYAGTATFFSYVLGIQSVNLGSFTPIVAFMFWSFFSFIAIKVAFILLPILAGLVGVVRRLVSLVLDFLPF